MQVTDVRVRMANGTEGKLKAYCSVVFDGMFVVHDLRVIEGINGVFVSMPRVKTIKGEFKDIAHPITAEARELVHNAVLNAFRQMENKANIIA